MNIFIPVVGQFTNIGDVLHRRVLLSWLRPCGQLHIYVGKAPRSFIEGLDLAPEDICYTTIGSWLGRLVFSPLRQTAWVFTPGEMRLGAKRFLLETALLPFILKVRIGHGAVLRVGVAFGSAVSRIWGDLWRGLFKVSSRITWRTFRGQSRFRIGDVAPDLAFYELEEKSLESQNRTWLVVSMRYDRPPPSANWVAAVRTCAETHGWTPMVVSQVRMDNVRTEALARELNAPALPWRDESSHPQQEAVLRDVYRKAAMIVSDRLHVLIAGCTCEANPACILTALSDKVNDHFDVLGLNQMSLYDDSRSVAELTEYLEQRFSQAEEVRSACIRARERLEEVRSEIHSRLRGPADEGSSATS